MQYRIGGPQTWYKMQTTDYVIVKKLGLIFVGKVEITLKVHWKAQRAGPIFALMPLYTLQGIEISGVVASLSLWLDYRVKTTTISS